MGEFGVPSREEEALTQVLMQADQKVMQIVHRYISEHTDPYPFVLAMLKEVLYAGRDAMNCGGSEPRAIQDILDVVRTQVRKDDIHSIHLLED